MITLNRKTPTPMEVACQPNELAYLNQDWTYIKNYEFKLLIMVAILAEDHLAFWGPMEDICKFLGIKERTRVRDDIKKALSALVAKNQLIVTEKNGYYTLSLDPTILKDSPKQLVLKKTWINTIKDYKSEDKNRSVAWENTLRVFLYLCDNEHTLEAISYKQIAADLGISTGIVSNAITALTNISACIGDLGFARKMHYYRTLNGECHNGGQSYTIAYLWQ